MVAAMALEAPRLVSGRLPGDDDSGHGPREGGQFQRTWKLMRLSGYLDVGLGQGL